MGVTEFRLRRAQGVLASLACRERLFQLPDTVEKDLVLMGLGRRLRYGGRYVPKFPQFFDWGHDRPKAEPEGCQPSPMPSIPARELERLRLEHAVDLALPGSVVEGEETVGGRKSLLDRSDKRC
jgi:hypothetical protein